MRQACRPRRHPHLRRDSRVSKEQSMTTIGKNRGLARLADKEGHFTMVALDQRPPLFAAIAKARGVFPGQVTFEDMLKAKRLLVEALAQDASSMLFDPNFAIPAAIDILP